MPMKDTYKFTGEVKEQVENFKKHLQKQHLNDNTTRQKTNYAGFYLNWLDLNQRNKKYCFFACVPGKSRFN